MIAANFVNAPAQLVQIDLLSLFLVDQSAISTSKMAIDFPASLKRRIPPE
jgi:hypothetical protein